MRWRFLFTTIAIVLAAAVCMRLGFWQWSRWGEKQALNAATRAALAAPPLTLGAPLPPFDHVEGRPVVVRGVFDETRHVLLSGRVRNGEPGVEVVTPLVLDGGAVLLVNRGWLPAADGATAHPAEHPERGSRSVRGLAEPLRAGAGGRPMRTWREDSTTLISARWLDRDSLASFFPSPIVSWVLRALPDSSAPPRPARAAPRPLDEFMHLSYAVQWFLFAAILVGGSLLVAARRGRT